MDIDRSIDICCGLGDKSLSGAHLQRICWSILSSRISVGDENLDCLSLVTNYSPDTKPWPVARKSCGQMELVVRALKWLVLTGRGCCETSIANQPVFLWSGIRSLNVVPVQSGPYLASPGNNSSTSDRCPWPRPSLSSVVARSKVTNPLFFFWLKFLGNLEVEFVLICC